MPDPIKPLEYDLIDPEGEEDTPQAEVDLSDEHIAALVKAGKDA